MIMIDEKGGRSLIFVFLSFRVGIEEEFYNMRMSLHAFCVPWVFFFFFFFEIKKEDQNTIR